ncbi:transcription antitermination protein NusG [Lentisphaera araneosa HTCC2155]|uniref:Transcription antitermination protein NusG n=1 Tax=Lentisphaera araneosa HTCC2155 TaxID=313628 RepID=A6DPM2_9BACT|nr:transcription termination/antitermination NusG family protein [Lentisphaera araneosa]EDM26317.1 transcription antitermination protein NusG [Lentisphaera araneosa HTCC2155]
MEKLGQWYTLQALSGKENKARQDLERRIEQDSMQDSVLEVLLPTEKVTTVRQGKKITQNRKFYPGYLFVNVDLIDENGTMKEDVWHFVKNTYGIINFLGGDKPVPLSDDEIQILSVSLRKPKMLLSQKLNTLLVRLSKSKKVRSKVSKGL